jgi:hypothetical protein
MQQQQPEIKIQIQKYKVIGRNWHGPGDWGRYYKIATPNFTPGIDFQTEADFAYALYRRYGSGRYLILDWKKGRKGFRKYWLGNVSENGFIRDTQIRNWKKKHPCNPYGLFTFKPGVLHRYDEPYIPHNQLNPAGM